MHISQFRTGDIIQRNKPWKLDGGATCTSYIESPIRFISFAFGVLNYVWLDGINLVGKRGKTYLNESGQTDWRLIEHSEPQQPNQAP